MSLTRQAKFLYAAAWGTLCAAMGIIMLVIYWTVWPFEGLVDVKIPISVDAKTVEVGALQTATMTYCVGHDLPVPITVAREMELQTPDGQVFPLAPPVTYLIEQRCETKKLSFGIASFIPPGPYHVHYTTSLQVNPMREVRQTFITDPFIVVRPAE